MESAYHGARLLIRIIFFHCQCVSPYVTENVLAKRWNSRDSRESRKLQRFVSVSSQTKFWTSRSRLNLGDMGLGSRFCLGSVGLVHIPVEFTNIP